MGQQLCSYQNSVVCPEMGATPPPLIYLAGQYVAFTTQLRGRSVMQASDEVFITQVACRSVSVISYLTLDTEHYVKENTAVVFSRPTVLSGYEYAQISSKLTHSENPNRTHIKTLNLSKSL